LSAVDATLDKKGIAYNTEVSVKIITKDDAGRRVVVERIYDRAYFENGKLHLVEGKGKNLTRQQDINQSIADSWVQKHGGKAEIIRRGGKPPRAHKTLPQKSLGLTGSYDVDPGNLEVVHGNASPKAKNALRSNNMHVDDWKKGKSALPDAPHDPVRARFTQPDQPPKHLTQHEAWEGRRKNIGERKAAIEAGHATRGGKSMFRRITSILPVVGAFSRVMLETQDVSAAETGARIIGSELGIGPFDLELLYDYFAEMHQKGREERELRQLDPEYDREMREAAHRSIDFDRKQSFGRPKY